MKTPKKISTATLLTCVMITPVANGLVYTHAQTVINNGDHSNQIAIVNEDKGVVNAKGETVRYSDQFLPSYNKDGYIVTSLYKARNSGYLAYVVVPSNFSSNVESINTQPTQSVLGYYIEDEAHANEAVMKIVQLEMNFNRDIGKLYVGSILNEFYQAQDNAEIVLNNSSRIDYLLNIEENIDYKTSLQELLQQNGDISIKYITEKNDDVFNSIVQVNGVNVGVGTGINKKLAEQQAAKSAMKKEPDKK